MYTRKNFNYQLFFLILILLSAILLPLGLLFVRPTSSSPRLLPPGPCPTPNEFDTLVATNIGVVPINLINGFTADSLSNRAIEFHQKALFEERDEAYATLQTLTARSEELEKLVVQFYANDLKLANIIALRGIASITPSSIHFDRSLQQFLKRYHLQELANLWRSTALTPSQVTLIADTLKVFSAQQLVLNLHKLLQIDTNLPGVNLDLHQYSAAIKTAKRLTHLPAIPNAYGNCYTVATHSLSFFMRAFADFSGCRDVNKLESFLVSHDSHQFIVFSSTSIMKRLASEMREQSHFYTFTQLNLQSFLQKLAKLDPTARIADLWLPTSLFTTPTKYLRYLQQSEHRVLKSYPNSMMAEALHVATQLPNLSSLPGVIKDFLLTRWQEYNAALLQIAQLYKLLE